MSSLAFLQHDQVKIDFIENDGLETLMYLMKCISDLLEYLNDATFLEELKFKADSELNEEHEFNNQFMINFIENAKNNLIELIKESELLILETLFALSFNKKAAEILKTNKECLSKIGKPADDKDITKIQNQRFKKAVDGLLWKLGKEDQFKKQQQQQIRNGQNNGFDMMISYSWDDKPLVKDIYKYLTEQCNYRIWLDENEMTGSLCQAMAQAVEKSKFILMCMSEKYKASQNCRNEVEYARDRKKIIIPLIVKQVERDGWLGFISAGKIYIDFANQDFQKAIQLLNSEINRNICEKEISIQSIKSKENTSTITVPIPQTTTKSLVRPNIINNNYQQIPIELWSEQHVQDFLFDKKLDMMILLTENMNGEELYQLLIKCQTQSDYWIIFDRLNNELEKRYQQTLPISVYLRFVNQTQKFINTSAF